jgi:hypothetical protein
MYSWRNWGSSTWGEMIKFFNPPRRFFPSSPCRASERICWKIKVNENQCLPWGGLTLLCYGFVVVCLLFMLLLVENKTNGRIIMMTHGLRAMVLGERAPKASCVNLKSKPNALNMLRTLGQSQSAHVSLLRRRVCCNILMRLCKYEPGEGWRLRALWRLMTSRPFKHIMNNNWTTF